MKPKTVICSRCDLPIYDEEPMIIIAKGTNIAASTGGEIGSKTTTTDTLRHGDTAVCMERLKREARGLRNVLTSIRQLTTGAEEWD